MPDGPGVVEASGTVGAKAYRDAAPRGLCSRPLTLTPTELQGACGALLVISKQL